MICIEDIGHLLPNHKSGKIVGIASHRGEYIIVACEHGLYRLWDDGIGQIKADRDPKGAAEELDRRLRG
jgi:hypothetical protein